MHRIGSHVPAPVAPPRGCAVPAVSEGSRGGLRRDHRRSRGATLSSRCRDVTRGHDRGSARHRPPGSRASVRDRIRGGARAPVLWPRAAARPSATATREDAPCAEPWQRGRDTTEPRNMTESRGTGTQGRSSAFRVLPRLPWSGSRPPASVKKGRKWREQSQFAERSKYLCSFLLSDESYPASRANKANFAGPWPPGSRASVRDRTRRRAPAPVLLHRAAPPHPATATREVARYPEPLQRGWDTIPPAGRCQKGAETARTKPICWAI
jgi:hypothetical protein